MNTFTTRVTDMIEAWSDLEKGQSKRTMVSDKNTNDQEEESTQVKKISTAERLQLSPNKGTIEYQDTIIEFKVSWFEMMSVHWMVSWMNASGWLDWLHSIWVTIHE